MSLAACPRGITGCDCGARYCRGDRGLDPRDPDYSRPGIFATHNCWKCKDGQKPCASGNPRACEYPHARND